MHVDESLNNSDIINLVESVQLPVTPESLMSEKEKALYDSLAAFLGKGQAELLLARDGGRHTLSERLKSVYNNWQTELSTISQNSVEEIRPTSLKNRPKADPPLLFLSEERVGSPGNLIVLLAQPGHGKSRCVTEGILCSLLNEEADCLGWTAEAPTSVYFDTERSLTDHCDALEILYRKGEINIENDLPNHPWFWLGDIDSFDRKTEIILKYIEKNSPKIVIIDGVADLCPNTNDIILSSNLVLKLTAAAKKYNSCVVTIIHGNPGSGKNAHQREKPVGHLGSLLCRKAESVLLLNKDEEGVFTIRLDFANGKNRNGSTLMKASFKWSNDSHCMVSCSPSVLTKKQKTLYDHFGLLRKEIKNTDSFTKAKAKNVLVENVLVKNGKKKDCPCSEAYAYDQIKELVKEEMLFEEDGLLYWSRPLSLFE